jgi:hypothetical protein
MIDAVLRNSCWSVPPLFHSASEKMPVGPTISGSLPGSSTVLPNRSATSAAFK